MIVCHMRDARVSNATPTRLFGISTSSEQYTRSKQHGGVGGAARGGRGGRGGRGSQLTAASRDTRHVRDRQRGKPWAPNCAIASPVVIRMLKVQTDHLERDANEKSEQICTHVLPAKAERVTDSLEVVMEPVIR
ncbi:hypothetical protein EVAR_58938_1 [Eumeta japonica]|uniref:Uncharacterized protein n=1 Tax=Eumeta variegata TaxID=151549 RepID=A0A4C1Y6L6_EUMVA|nr:hypothetical protein EVAR_58938_1 [Eumeta japonica]